MNICPDWRLDTERMSIRLLEKKEKADTSMLLLTVLLNALVE